MTAQPPSAAYAGPRAFTDPPYVLLRIHALAKDSIR